MKTTPRWGRRDGDAAIDWRERLERFAHRYRAILKERPNLVQLIATRPVRSPEALRHVAAGGAALMRAGFTREQCFHIGNGVAMLMIGAVLAELGPKPLVDPKTDARSAFADAMNNPAAKVHDHDAIFDFALAAMLDGFAVRLAELRRMA